MDVLTVEDLARILRLRPDTVRKLLRDDVLPGKKAGRDWRVTRSALEVYLGEPAAPAKED